jgi:GntR family transcriptional regulator
MNVDGLPITPVDSNSPVPLYHQIEIDLRQLIESGRLQAHDPLPPEITLCRMYGVGRHTMRMALARLVSDNLIARKAGRGTFVRETPDPTRFYLDRSFTRQMEEMGLKPHSEVLELSVGRVDATAPRAFQGHTGEECCLLVRLRFGDEQPIGLQESFILTRLCPGLERHDFMQESLYDVLHREYNLAINEIHHAVGAAVADDRKGPLLQVSPGAPLLVVNTTAYANDRVIIESSTSYYRADRYEFSTTHLYDLD